MALLGERVTRFVDTDFAVIVRQMDTGPDQLCDLCEELDVPAIFDYFIPVRDRVLSIEHVMQCSVCALCRVLRAAVMHRQGLHESSSITLRPRLPFGPHELLETEFRPYSVLSAFFRQLNYSDDFNFDPEDPILVLEHFGELPERSCAEPVRGGAIGVLSQRATEDDSSSTDSDLKQQAQTSASAGITTQRTRTLIPECLDYDRLKTRLHIATKSSVGKDSGPPSIVEQRMNASLDRMLHSRRLRMIDIGRECVVTIPKREAYVALSYVWGDSAPNFGDIVCKAEKTDGDDVAWRVKWELVPQTIRDAAEFCRKLGQQYLWVDSLCIAQGNEADKQAVIPEMTSIYGCASLTIVAVAGVDADFGLPGVRADPRRREPVLRFESRGCPITLCAWRMDGVHAITSSKWNSRGWTYQEHLLSRESLFFTETEVYVCIGNSVFGESYKHQPAKRPVQLAAEQRVLVTNPPDSLLDAIHRFAIPSWRSYCRAVWDYTQRQLRYSSDRYNAFMGLFDRFLPTDSPPGAIKVFCGLPPQFFADALLWKPKMMHGGDCSHKRIPAIDGQAGALPSWSWVGWMGRMVMLQQKRKERTKSLRVHVLDECNVMCDSLSLMEPAPWPIQPTPLRNERSGSVFLHLWVRLLGCYISLTKRGRAAGGCDVFMTSAEALVNQRLNSIGFIQLNENLRAEYCDGGPHHFIVLDTALMLISKHESVYERVALGDLSLGSGSSREVLDEKGRRVVERIEGESKWAHVVLR